MLMSPADSVRAAGLGQPQSNYIRARFSTEQGLYSDIVDDIVQSHDGFLWMRVNGVDLDRFDGQHFESSNRVGRVGSLAVAPNGDLWVGSSDDLKQIPADELDQLDRWQPVSHPLGHGLEIVALHFTEEGVLWVGTNRGLYRFENGVFSPVIPGAYITRIEKAGNGHLWIATSEGPVEWDGSKAVSHPELAARLGVIATDIFHVLEDSKGVTWFCTEDGVARLVGGTLEKLEPYGPRGHATFAIYEDPRGRIWFARNEGLFQLTATGLQLVAADLKVHRMYGDRDGNLWVATNGQGLFRFKDLPVRTFTTADGLPNDVAMTVLAAHDGSVWAGFNCGGLSRFDGHGFRTYNEKDGLVNSCVWSLAEDSEHDMWIGTWGGGAFRFHQGKFTQYSKAQGLAEKVVTSVAAARDGSVFVAGNGSVSQIRDGRIRNYTSADGLSEGSSSYLHTDRRGDIWVTLTHGTERLVGDRFEPFLLLGKIRAPYMGEDSTGGLYFYAHSPRGPLGIFRMVNNQATQVAPGMKAQELRETKDGDFWLFSSEGILRIAPGGLENARRQDEPLDFEPFGLADGMPSNTGSAGIPTSTLTPDGKLWIATIRGLAVVDLPRLPKTNLKPTIYIEKVAVGRNSQTPPHELALPAGTHHLELYFDAIEITSPEKIRLQYRLDGVDSEWLDANPPGQAVYSTLSPGKYAFHIRACNRSGIWDRAGTVYYITQEPYFYQTHWFLAAGIAFGMLLIATMYQLRLQQMRRQFDAGLEARVQERTRIARDLHDTLLQSFHGVLLRFQAASNLLPERPSDAKQRLESAIDQAAQAITEGRDAVQGLRSSTTETNDVAVAISTLGKELGAGEGGGDSAVVQVRVEGTPRNLHPILRDEVYRIAGEALRNASRHAQARKIEVEIRYDDRELRLRVRDDGKGIDPNVLKEGGSDGHFGLYGMRERAKLVGGKLEVWSEFDAGTEVELSIPASIAYAKSQPRRSWFSRF
jgi:signal transduction histidine kinase/ligand-binding sensor domain-containing protein